MTAAMKRAAVLAILQATVILGWAAYHEHVWAHAPTFRIPLRPADPYDVVRGRYFVLNPLDRALKTGEPGVLLSPEAVAAFMGQERFYNGPALVGFCPQGAVHRVCGLGRSAATVSAGEYAARARASVAWEENVYDAKGGALHRPGWRVTLDFGLDKFFLPDAAALPGRENAPGWELEVSYRPGQNLLPRRLWFNGQRVRLGPG